VTEKDLLVLDQYTN